ncbi:hypothetical protein [Haloplanus halobius]|uniref:hypothetical protein n=1 Tax=Haloplanus halobius TaxID=2934938 RepID=UPI00200C78E3|nr:hypothetical protein [Haloplanus sp. XH21]
MPSSTTVDRPSEAVDIATQYRRLERPLSGAVALLVAAIVAMSIFSFSLVSGGLIAVTVLLAVRAPLFKTRGTARLMSDATLAAVRADFESTTPPMLAFQWGIADTVRSTPEGAVYEISYLFGLRSVVMELETRTDIDDTDVRLVVTTGENPWGTYDVNITANGDETAIDIEWASDRRFGLNRLPQWLLAERYRAVALAAQGYTVVDRDATLALVA